MSCRKHFARCSASNGCVETLASLDTKQHCSFGRTRSLRPEHVSKQVPTNAWRERGRKASRRRVAHNTEGTRTRNRTIEERTQIQQVDMNARARIEIEAKLLLSFLTTLKPELEWAHTAPKSRPNKKVSLEPKPSRANKKEN